MAQVKTLTERLAAAVAASEAAKEAFRVASEEHVANMARLERR